MNRKDFMGSLAEMLSDVSPAERDEAIQYYNNYFDDAGKENEQGVIDSLGSPEQLARAIKAGLADSGGVGEFTEKGFTAYEQKNRDEVLDLSRFSETEGEKEIKKEKEIEKESPSGGERCETNGGQQGNGQSGTDGWQYDKNMFSKEYKQTQNHKKLSGGMVAAVIALCILASPFLLGIGGGLFGIVVGVLGGLFGIVVGVLGGALGIIVGIGAAAAALLVAGVCLFVYGIALLFTLPLGGLAMMGLGMVLMGVGLFCLWLMVVVCAALIPAVVRGIVKLLGSIIHKGGVQA